MKRKAFTLSCNTHSSAPSTETSQRTFGPKPCHVRAFTLAEVLLTLAIIGVVAALTIPAVITKVTKDQYVVGLKKAYNTLKAVEGNAVQEHGELENWYLSSGSIFEQYLKPHFDILKDCSEETDEACFATGDYRLLSNKTVGNPNEVSGYKFVTSDGVAFLVQSGDWKYPEMYITVDVNGSKKPNQFGKDVFVFEFFKNGVKPYGYYSSQEDIDNNCSSEGEGLTCAIKVLSEGAINYSSGSEKNSYSWPISFAS